MTEEFRMVPAGRKTHVFLCVLGLFFAGIAVMFAYTAYSCRHVQYEVSRDGLAIRGQYGREIPASAIRAGEARRVDFAAEPALRPVGRTNGVGLPGFLAGWVRLQDGGKGLVFLTDRTRTVAVPTNDGYTLLLSVTDPDGLLESLRRQHGSAANTPREVFRMVPASGPAVWFCVGMCLLMASLVALFGYLGRDSLRVRYQVGDFGLRILGMYGRTIPATSLVVEQVRAMPLASERGLRPSIRTNGAGLPGFLAGWVRLENGQKALVFLTDWDRVVYIPTRDGYSVLLSATDPAAMVASLNAHAA